MFLSRIKRKRKIVKMKINKKCKLIPNVAEKNILILV
jgi:hypothetical protein